MIVLDTNVVSEALKLHPSDAVLSWLDLQIPETLFLTATSVCELLEGVSLMPDGKRKDSLKASLLALLNELFGSRILAFDYEAALKFVALRAVARAAGISVSMGDGQIAATALSKGFAVATRDTLPFKAAGVRVIDPWE